MAAETAALRAPDAGPFDLAITVKPGHDVAPWEAAGATWTLTEFDSTPKLDAVRAAIEAGPRG